MMGYHGRRLNMGVAVNWAKQNRPGRPWLGGTVTNNNGDLIEKKWAF